MDILSDQLLLPIMDNNLVPINQTTDYAHSPSHNDAEPSELYQQVSLIHGYTISQTTDAFGKRTASFWAWKWNQVTRWLANLRDNRQIMAEASSSEFEWQEEALSQLAIWMTTNQAPWPSDIAVYHDCYAYVTYRSEDGVVNLLLYSMVEADCVWI